MFMRIVQANAKAIVAVLLIIVAAAGKALGIETGIDIEEWWGVLGLTILGGGLVWRVPNRPLEDGFTAHQPPK